MTDIIVTLPKSTGGLKHLQQKIDCVREFDGYAWWWVSDTIKELEPTDCVHVVCEGRLRGWFTIKWIAKYNEHPDDLTVLTPYGKYLIRQHSENGTIFVREEIERADGSVYTTPSNPFGRNDIQMLWHDIDDWYKEGKLCIFFDEWNYDLEQPEMKGFQGYRYMK